MEPSLQKRTSKSLFWVAIDVFGQQLMQFGIGIFLARLLMPEEFGIIGLIAVFLAFSRVFVDSGLSFALLRKKEVQLVEYTTVFWFNLGMSTFFYLLLFLAAGKIAAFYNLPELNNIVKVLAILLIINAFGSVQEIKLKKALKFKTLTIIGFISKLVAGVTAIIMALKGFGVWSLVAQQFLIRTLRVLLLYVFNWFWPKLEFSVLHFRELFAVGSKLLYGSIVNAIVHNIYPVLIAKVFTVSDVGFFNRARGYQELPVLFITGIVQQVSLPTFALIQDEEDRFLSSYRRAIVATLFLVLLPLAILVVNAFPLIEFLITDKWLPAAPMLQILAIAGVFYPVSALNVNIIGIKGRTDLVMITQFLKDGLTILGIVVGIFFGIFGLLWAIAFTSTISFYINIHYTAKVINYPVKKQLVDLFPVVLLGLSSAGLGFLLSNFIHLSNLPYIIVQTLIISSFYLGVSYLLKVPELELAYSMLKNMIKK